MKTGYLLFIISLLALSSNTGIAQTFSDSLVKKDYNGETYVINNDISQNTLRASRYTPMSISIVNENEGELKGHSAAGGCYNLKETTPLEDVIKKAISQEKIKFLALNDKNRINIKFNYNIKTGQVVHLQFRLRNITLSDDMDSETEITLKDISILESLFKEYYFNVPEDCINRETNDIYGNWERIFWFSKLAAEKENEK